MGLTRFFRTHREAHLDRHVGLGFYIFFFVAIGQDNMLSAPNFFEKKNQATRRLIYLGFSHYSVGKSGLKLF
jgi:hypothetical protein